jgi:hypothetical protein
MAQPSLSLGIKKLEAELGQTLFLRSRDGITLSPNGKMLLPEAKEILNSLSNVDVYNKMNVSYTYLFEILYKDLALYPKRIFSQSLSIITNEKFRKAYLLFKKSIAMPAGSTPFVHTYKIY